MRGESLTGDVELELAGEQVELELEAKISIDGVAYRSTVWPVSA